MLLTYVLLHTCSFIRNLFARGGQNLELLFYMWEGKGNFQSRILKLALILQNTFLLSQKNFSHLLLFYICQENAPIAVVETTCIYIIIIESNKQWEGIKGLGRTLHANLRNI